MTLLPSSLLRSQPQVQTPKPDPRDLLLPACPAPTTLSPQAHSCFKPPSPCASPDGHCSLPAKSMHTPSLYSSHQTNNSRSLGVTSELRTRRQPLASGSWPGVLLLNPNISQNINTRQGHSARDRSRQTRPLHNHEQELYPKHKNVQTSPIVVDGVTAASLESQL